MAHWNNQPEREDGDGVDEGREDTAKARRFLRKKVSENMLRDPLYGMLADLENAASPFYLGLDYDEDTSDVDDMGPF